MVAEVVEGSPDETLVMFGDSESTTVKLWNFVVVWLERSVQETVAL